MEIKALACQLPRDLGVPFSRLTRDEIAWQAVHNVESLLLSAARRCGAGSTPMRFVPGVIAAGSGPETQISSEKLGEFLICIIEPGRVSDWGLKTM